MSFTTSFYMIMGFFGFLFLEFLAILVGSNSSSIHFEIKDRTSSTIALVVAGILHGLMCAGLVYKTYFKERAAPNMNLNSWRDKNPRAQANFVELSDENPSPL